MQVSRGLKRYLATGGVIAYPTESCFGLGCDPNSRLGVMRVLRLKRRPQRKGLILIADRADRFKRLIAPLSPAQQTQTKATWPGPHTWLVPKGQHCPHWLTGKHTSLAVRVTAHEVAANLSHAAGMALVSTSANRSGGKPAKTYRECMRLFGYGAKIIPGLIGRARKPSTIQDIVSGRILRP